MCYLPPLFVWIACFCIHALQDIGPLFTQKGTPDHPGGAQRRAKAKSFSCRPCSLADVCRLCSLLFNCYCCWNHWLFMHKMEGELGFLWGELDFFQMACSSWWDDVMSILYSILHLSELLVSGAALYSRQRMCNLSSESESYQMYCWWITGQAIEFMKGVVNLVHIYISLISVDTY